MIRIAARDLEEDVFTEIQVEHGWENIVRAVILRALIAADFEVMIEDENGEMIQYEEYSG